MRIEIVLVVAALAAQPGPVGAQDTGAAAACAAIVSDGERLACYDRALRAAPPAPVPAAAAAAVAAPAAESARAAEPAASSAAPPTAAAAPPAHAVAPAEAPRAIVPIVVLKTRAMPGRGFEFTTDEGDVWLADSQPLNLPATPFNAQLKPGTFGSVFLVPENRLGIRVRHRD